MNWILLVTRWHTKNPVHLIDTLIICKIRKRQWTRAWKNSMRVGESVNIFLTGDKWETRLCKYTRLIKLIDEDSMTYIDQLRKTIRYGKGVLRFYLDKCKAVQSEFELGVFFHWHSHCCFLHDWSTRRLQKSLNIFPPHGIQLPKPSPTLCRRSIREPWPWAIPHCSSGKGPGPGPIHRFSSHGGSNRRSLPQADSWVLLQFCPGSINLKQHLSQPGLWAKNL